MYVDARVYTVYFIMCQVVIREANPGAPIPGAPDRLSPDFYPGDG